MLKKADIPREPYEAWLDYYRRKAEEDDWEGVVRAQRRRPASFAASEGGQIAAAANGWQAELDRLYAELVTEPGQAGSAAASVGAKLREQVAVILGRADIAPQIRVSVEGRFGEQGRAVPIAFDFGFVNGQQHLIDALPLGGPRGIETALAFNARASAVLRAKTAKSFFAFYDSAAVTGGRREEILVALEGVANTVDLTDTDEAVETMREFAH